MNSTNQSTPDYLFVHFVGLNIIFFLTLLGNFTVVFVIIQTKNRKSCCVSFNNKNRISFYILSLSIADINVAFLSILPQIIELNNIYWLDKSNLACKIVRFIQVFPVYASTYILIEMGVDRFNCICRPIRSVAWTSGNALRPIILAYVISAILSSPQLLIWHVDKNDLYQNITNCHASFGSDNKLAFERFYLFYHAVAHFLIPLVVLICLYTRIAFTVNRVVHSKRESARKILQTESETTSSKNLKSFYTIRSTKSSRDNTSLNVIKQEKVPMLKNNSLNVFGNEDKASSLVTSELKVRQHITKKSLYTLNKTKIRTFKSTLTIVIAFIFCTLPFYTTEILLTIIGKPEKMSDDFIKNLMRKIFIIFLTLFQH